MSDDFFDELAGLPRKIRVLLAAAPAAMAYVDREQRFRFTNERFRAWVSATRPGGVVGLRVADVAGDRYPNVRPFVERALQGRAAAHEEHVEGPDGKRMWIRSVLVPDIEDGEVLGYVLMTTDITRSKRAEQELERERRDYASRLEREVAERTAQLRELQHRLLDAKRLIDAEEMAGAVAHAINNPLAALLGTVQMAQQGMIPGESALERIGVLGKRIEEVVQGTLSMYRRGEVNICEESLSDLIEWVRLELTPRARSRRAEIVCKVEQDLPLVFADRTLLGSALGAVAENAVHATPEGGSVWIEAEQLHQGLVVRVRISDEGPGIPTELRAKVLEPFFTTRRRGTGFGLTIASAVVQGHGGSLRILDRPGGGAAIEIDLLTAQGSHRSSGPAHQLSL